MHTHSPCFAVLALAALGPLAPTPLTRAAEGPATITAGPASQTVLQGAPATFTLGVDGTQPIRFQWYRDGTALAGATNQSYTIAATAAGDDGAVFWAAATNALGGIVSGPAVLTVDPGIIMNLTNRLLEVTNLWKYNQIENLDGVNWTAPGYNDSGWGSGGALLYVENADVGAPKTTALILGRNTYYFRTSFVLTNSNVSDVTLTATYWIDDGAVFYLNGSEVHRIRMSPGPVSYATVADTTVGDATAEGPVSIPVNNLVAGTNVVAVEVHQVNSTSSDIVFGMLLEALLSYRAPDTLPPTVASVIAATNNRVRVIFSERVDPLTATNGANYTINGGINISGAAFRGNDHTIELATSPLSENVLYTLTINQVRDRAVNPNTISPDTTVNFMLGGSDFTAQAIGNPLPPGLVNNYAGGADITAGGTDIGGTSDQFMFSYQTLSGDFDMQARVAGLANSDVWAKAGLMARETLDANSRFAATLATPSAGGVVFESRATAGVAATLVGSFPANYPNTWLRLRRAGNLFTGYSSFDGEHWLQLGSVTIAMSNVVYFGMAASSHNTAQATTAQFRDLQPVIEGTAGGIVFPIEPPGPSSRKTGLAITEIMYRPAARTDGKALEFVELYNSNPFSEDISGYRLSGDVDYVFPTNTVLPGGGYLVVAKNPADFQSEYGLSGVLGPFASTNTLPASGVIRLRNKQGAIYLEVPYSDQPPWPVAADGTGHSLVLARPSYGEGYPQAWAISDRVGGSPGGFDGYTGTPLRNVLINEFLAHTDPPLEDFIELYNHSNQRIDLSGCILTDDKTIAKFIIPSNTWIGPTNFIVFYQTQLGFGLNSGGETIYFWDPTQTRVLDVMRFEAQANGISSGRQPDGGPEVYPLQTRTPGAPNSRMLIGDIVINEIMYAPISGDADDEYVELFNQGTNAVDLGGWRFTVGIGYTFPTNTVMPRFGYLVVAKNAARLIANYTNLNAANTLGNFSGTLANRGERLALGRPDLEYTTNRLGEILTNTVYVIVDEVTYGTGGSWGNWAHGGGSSLELLDGSVNHRLAYNWADSDETAKAPWTQIEATGVMDNGAGTANYIEVLGLGEGECLLDDVEVLQGGAGANLLASANSNFESGLGGWLSRGTHIRSSLETSSGYGGGQCFHVRTSSRGDSIANRSLCPLTATPSGTVGIRAKARWLKGWPEILLRLHGNYYEAFGRMTVPTNLGTPGARNSRAVGNPGPAIYAVTHTPVLPADNEQVVVTARIDDLEGVGAARVLYRLDPATAYLSVPMTDDGTGGDAVAADGVYSATIPGQTAGTLVAFQVGASDNRGATNVFPKQIPSYALPFECLVRFGDPAVATSFGTYRQWFTQGAVNAWQGRPALSNERLFGTFVNGNFRVIYNMSSRWSGSPYHQFTGSPVTTGAHYSIALPGDDLMLGTDNFNKIHAPGNGPYDDNTIQREQICYWTARQMGLPWNYRRYVNMFFNGNRRNGTTSLMEDTEVPGDELVESRFPNHADGDLYKLQPWFEVDDGTGQTLGFVNNSWCTLNRFLTVSNGVTMHKTARYRHNYLVRAANGTANNYAPVFALIDAANSPKGPLLTANMDAVVDLEQWYRIFAVEHASGNWDAYGCRNEQNMYGYKPRDGKWQLLIWDWNIVLGNSGSWSPGADLFTVTSGQLAPLDVVMESLYTHMPFRRIYFRALKELCNGPWVPQNFEPLLDAKYRAITASGITVASPDVIKTWIASARSSILTTVRTEDATNFVVTGTNVVTTSNNLVTLTGIAPVEIRTITINGAQYPITWTSVRNWTVRVPVAAQTNLLNFAACDEWGNPLTNYNASVTVLYTGDIPDPRTTIAFNEIMYQPATPDASYVELFNRSDVFSFDLSGWRINGLGYTFPPGSIITNGQYLVLAQNRTAFTTAYSGGAAAFGECPGQLDPDGETLTLIKPGPTPEQDLVIDKVRYENRSPWPATANGYGPSLQLIDAAQDNARVSNWSDGSGWRFFSTNLNVSSLSAPRLMIYLDTTNVDFYIDQISVRAVGGPTDGVNILANGDFESALTGPWNLGTNYLGTEISSTIKYAGNGALHIVGAGRVGTANTNQSIWQDVIVITNTTYTLSYWYLPTTNASKLTMRLNSAFRPELIVKPPAPYTPGAANLTVATLPPYDPVWLNELQPQNVGGPLDQAGEAEPWIELYNTGTNALTLAGYYLADNYTTNLLAWAFPDTALLQPGEYKLIIADGQPSQSTPAEWHTSFRLAPGSGTLALVRVVANTPQITDYLTYTNLTAGLSYGDYPDGQPFNRRVFFYPTPGTTNTAPPVDVFINEWMADNATTLDDPDEAGANFEDWFELYNAGDLVADLSGYYLSDTLTNRTDWRIPAGTVIAPHGYLLVWADGEPAQNSVSNRQDLHAGFQLARGGENLSLFSPEGGIIDQVSFGPQTADVSQGRYPNGQPGTNYYWFTNSTPRAPNYLDNGGANQPPHLGGLPEQYVILGQSLHLLLTATDPDPGQSLNFSFGSQGPAGATLSAGGQLDWTPTEAQAPSTNRVSVQVTDNGNPPLSAGGSLTVFVLSPPEMSIVPAAGGSQVTLSFPTVAGKRYQVLYKNDLNDAAWLNLGPVHLATGSSLVITDNIGALPHRFYQIQVVE